MNKTIYLKPWETKCPKCGSTHIIEISRITGYLAFNERFGSGKTKERNKRIDHNNKHNKIYE
jgi:ribonucleoside-triphosphate reductase